MDLDDIVTAITAGDLDGQLGQLFDALFARANETEVGFGWKLTLDGDQWTQETVTLAELAFAEHACSTGGNKVSYLELDPIRSMEHCVALIVAHLHKASGYDVRKAFARAEQLTVTDLADVVSAYEVKAPKAAGGETLPGS